MNKKLEAPGRVQGHRQVAVVLRKAKQRLDKGAKAVNFSDLNKQSSFRGDLLNTYALRPLNKITQQVSALP